MQNKNVSFYVFLFLVLFSQKAHSFNLEDCLISFSTGGLINVGKYCFEESLKAKESDTDSFFLGLKNKSNFKTADDKSENKDNVSFDDVIGLSEPIREVKEVVDYLKNPDKFKAMGAKMPKGILLEGPPGTGKTLIARAIANEAGCNFYYESASSFVEMFVGVGAKRVREIFEKAKRNKPAVIFIDEIDAIGAANRGIGGNEEYRQTLVALLTEMDGFNKEDSIVIIAATNNALALDKALKRPGRFTRMIHISLPDKDSRKEILQYYIKKLPRVEFGDSMIENLATKTAGFSGADLENLVNEAVMLAVRENAEFVQQIHFEAALKKLSNRDCKRY